MFGDGRGRVGGEDARDAVINGMTEFVFENLIDGFGE